MNQLPKEVCLVGEVKKCRKCQWFWGPVPPYGPFPAFDWEQEFPKAFLNQPEPSMDVKPIKWTQATTRGDQAIEPGVLRGCRKAPIMTIGINPNMTAYFASQHSATWAYPDFQKEQTYAYYYRHATIFQESVSQGDVRSMIVPGTELFAEEDGVLVSVNRSQSHRWLLMEVGYKTKGVQRYEMAWSPSERTVILVGESFKKGDCLLANIVSEPGREVDIYANGTGYYQRLLPILADFKSAIGQADSAIAIGEDISMHDMVACASPGWNPRYDIPMERIAHNCVNEQQFLFDQLLQSRPAVILIVSTSSLEMFAGSVKALGGSLSLDYQERDVFDLLRETCEREHWVKVVKGEQSFTARFIVTPHFSYQDNFVPQARFALTAWEAFEKVYPNTVQLLKEENRVGKVDDHGFLSIQINQHDPLATEISEAAWQELMGRYCEPNVLIVGALKHEFSQQRLVFNEETGHLDRAGGSCAYCVNEQWRFPEGCPYGKC